MKAATREWIDKTEGDWATLMRELRARRAPNYDPACFHAQQCAEKYLKGRLHEESIAFPKTHDLLAILDLLLSAEPLWASLRPNLSLLRNDAIAFRYPGETADKDEAREAMKLCREVRNGPAQSGPATVRQFSAGPVILA